MAGMHHVKILLLMLTIALVGCSDPLNEQIERQTPITEQRVEQLAKGLKNGSVRNATF